MHFRTCPKICMSSIKNDMFFCSAYQQWSSYYFSTFCLNCQSFFNFANAPWFLYISVINLGLARVNRIKNILKSNIFFSYNSDHWYVKYPLSIYLRQSRYVMWWLNVIFNVSNTILYYNYQWSNKPIISFDNNSKWKIFDWPTRLFLTVNRIRNKNTQFKHTE